MPESTEPPRIPMPALLRHARSAYGLAMRKALEEAGYDDVPKNGLYVIGGLALGAGDVPLASLIRDLRISKQAAGQLVDTLVHRGYLARNVDEQDRRRLIVLCRIAAARPPRLRLRRASASMRSCSRKWERSASSRHAWHLRP
jgi:hypothetical protein